MPVSNKTTQWRQFAIEVEHHIENYVIPQYGDYPDDMAENFTLADIKAQLKRYDGRIGVNARGIVEARRDCLKIAHYACLLLNKLSLPPSPEQEGKEMEMGGIGRHE